MEESGTRHTVTVTGERRVKPLLQRSSDWYYTLSEGGVRLPGELVSGFDDFDPGEVVEVYSDGEKHLPAGDVEQAHTAAVFAGASHLIALPLMAATGYFAPMRGRATRGRSY